MTPFALARRGALVGIAATLTLGLVACGNDDDDSSRQQGETSTTATEGADLAAIKGYLLEHTERLVADTGRIRANAERYYQVAKAAKFDYARLLQSDRAELRRLLHEAQRAFSRANPSYEEMEGVVAGVPSLAEYDVIIDAGGDASDPENAVPFDLETPAGRTLKQPGNFNFLIETAAFGTEAKFQADGVEPDLDGDGRVEFGESLPDADFYVAAAREFERYAKQLDAAARDWQPTASDALTALVVMTPTMSEYFEAWKNSRFIAGQRATETAFVAASRLQDIADILSGLVLVYDNVRPLVAKADRQQAEQTEQGLRKLRDFAAELRDEEAAGRRYSAEEADTLGSQAQERAEAIAGQITQAAAKLNIEL
jgi:hypothetical protein